MLWDQSHWKVGENSATRLPVSSSLAVVNIFGNCKRCKAGYTLLPSVGVAPPLLYKVRTDSSASWHSTAGLHQGWGPQQQLLPMETHAIADPGWDPRLARFHEAIGSIHCHPEHHLKVYHCFLIFFAPLQGFKASHSWPDSNFYIAYGTYFFTHPIWSH